MGLILEKIRYPKNEDATRSKLWKERYLRSIYSCQHRKVSKPGVMNLFAIAGYFVSYR